MSTTMLSNDGSPQSADGSPSSTTTNTRYKSSGFTPPATFPLNISPASSAPSANANDPSKPSPQVAASAPHFNPRSCTTCRRRKVRCDKKHPCSNCAKAGIECIFPKPGRAPRKVRKALDTELLARLRRLEGVVQSLGAQVEEENDPLNNGNKTTSRSGSQDVNSSESNTNPERARDGQQISKCIQRFDPTYIDTEQVGEEFGRLVVESETGRSRYVSNQFWASLSDQVAELRDLLGDDSDEEMNELLPSSPSGSSSTGTSFHQGFIFGFHSAAHSLRQFHPSPSQVFTFWSIFRENVDPMCRMIHKPTMAKTLMDAAGQLDCLSKSMEALLFSIYFSSVVSLSPKECVQLLGEEKDAALAKYRFAVEQALARANFLDTQEIVVLQALVLFLVCVRRHDHSRFVWSLSGLATRIAFSLGCHRDGSKFKLSPFETEIRRRLWWEVCVLDIRCCEDHGADPQITEASFDTRLPLNINDEDISPDTKETPIDKIGYTEATFCLIRYNVTNTLRRLNYVPPGSSHCRTMATKATTKDKEALIEACHNRIEEKYLKNADTSIPLIWVTVTVSRLVIAKMWMFVHHPFIGPNGASGLDQETTDRLFATAIEVMEFSVLLETDRNTEKWGWLFRSYMQWHAVAFVLSELCTRTAGEQVDRAWTAVETLFHEVREDAVDKVKGTLWRPLLKLWKRAKVIRAKELEKQARFPCDGTIGPVAWRNSPGITSHLGGTDPLTETMQAVGGLDGFGPTEISAAYNSWQGDTPPRSSSISSLSRTSMAPQGQSQSQPQSQIPIPMPTQPFTLESARNLQPLQSPSDLNINANSVQENGINATDVDMNLGDVNWENWENTVREFETATDTQEWMEKGPGLSTSFYWW
ncbi:MAG: hypothetical protein M1834_005666 [Cirrosporium novae-zelandiae]|nr:MAG: hypothetical protein M1834_005666 [Cirrosporium novae-zelandiae]